MKLSLRDKHFFYDALARLMRSGSALSKALELLAQDARGGLRRFLRELREAVLRGDTVSEAFAKQRPAISDMELSIVTACERSGRFDRGCEQLAAYFQALERARAIVWKRSAYPLFLLHFGIFTVSLPALFTGAGAVGYFEQTVGLLVVVYAVAGIIALGVRQLLRLGATSSAVDRLLRMLPGFKKVRTSFATARFCATYDAQLDAGVNVMEALTSAAQASGSALILDCARQAMPQLRAGSQVGPLLGKGFPREMVRAFRVAEGTGDLDQELKRLAEHYEHEALQRVETLTEWLPRIIYLLVALYIGYRIVNFYSQYLGAIEKATEL